MPEIDVRLVDVTKSFGPDAVAVDHISLDVFDGEFFSLLGPSGCGKTTTLRMIGGFEEPTSGLIELQGQDVTWLPPFKRNVNTVFQNYALFPHLTIYENVAFGLRRRKVADAEVKRRVPEMLELVELRGFDKRKPGQISGGQAQRVALARALINRPAVLLLDEPLGALDLKLRKQMQVELKRIQQEVGITFIYVTHDQEEAMTMSDRVAVMNRGRYEQLGRPEELYERPATRFVAGFLGASNLLHGRAEGADGAYSVVRLDGSSVVRVPTVQLAGRARVDVGVRPEKIRLLETDRPGPGRCQHAVRPCPQRAVHGRQHPVPGRPARRIAWSWSTSRTSNGRAPPRSGRWRGGPTARWSPEDTFAVDPPASCRCLRRGDAGHGRAAHTPAHLNTRNPSNRTGGRRVDRSIRPRHQPTLLETPRLPPAGAPARRGRRGRRLPGWHRPRPGSAAAGAGRRDGVASRWRPGSATWTSTTTASAPSLDRFQKETGRRASTTRRSVDDNEAFFASQLQGPLAGGAAHRLGPRGAHRLDDPAAGQLRLADAHRHRRRRPTIPRTCCPSTRPGNGTPATCSPRRMSRA